MMPPGVMHNTLSCLVKISFPSESLAQADILSIGHLNVAYCHLVDRNEIALNLHAYEVILNARMKS
jgi:hypothetical protein